jgi:predicted TIM-barrel fold metal-dependent hydrolase
MTPALVDFSKWVEDDHNNPMSQQIAVMSRIARRKNGPRIHGFVGFDPLRQAMYEKNHGPDAENSLKLAQRAIAEQGFIGIKLYPPMGFRPSDNAKLGKDFPCHVRFGVPDEKGPCAANTPVGHDGIGSEPGALLDDVLMRLYAWCADNNVPIMAHTANSNGTSPDYDMRADPKFWKPVLAAFPKLPLNLAHFGNFVTIDAQHDPIPIDKT